MSRLLKRLAIGVWLVCAVNLLWSITGGWAITVQRLHTPLSWDDPNSDWQAHRYVASNGGSLVVNWPLFPDDPKLLRDGPSFTMQLTRRRGGSFILGYGEYAWPSWIAEGHGWSRLGVMAVWSPKLYFRNYRGIAIPWWMLTVATSPFVIVPLYRLIVRRSRPGLCHQCGYDLRATPDRCPECGAVPAPPAPAAA